MNDKEWETIYVVDKPLGKFDEKSVGRYGVVPAGRLVMQLDNIAEKLYWVQNVKDSSHAVLIESEKGKTADENVLLCAFENRLGFSKREIKERMVVYIWRYCLRLQGVALENMMGEVPVLNQSSICNDKFNTMLEELLGFKVDSTDIGISHPFTDEHSNHSEFSARLNRYYGRIARLRKMNGLLYNEEQLQKGFETDALLQEGTLEEKVGS